MMINKAIRQVMRNKKVSLSQMGRLLEKEETELAISEDGTKFRKPTGNVIPLRGNDVSARLVKNNLQMDKVVEMLSVLGYEVVIQEIRPGKRREDQIVIDQKEE